MNIENIQKLKGIIELLIENESRINEHKPVRYWYPLSLATYGVEEIVEALDSLCSFRTSMAEKTLQFERNYAKWQGAADSVMVNSGSSADLLLCFLLRNPLQPMLQPGDEILIPVVTWPTQIWSAMMVGLKVKLLDVDPITLNVSPEEIERKITSKTKAIFLVHLMGNPCSMDKILEIARAKKLLVLEDCCEAMGAEWKGKKVGNFGIGGAFSFFFSHHMTTMEGGMISVQDLELAEQFRLMRAHGWVRNVDPKKYALQNHPEIDPRYAFVNWGFNLRPTEVQAGFGIRQLEKLPGFNLRRQVMADRFFQYIAGVPELAAPRVEAGASPSWLALPLMVAKDARFSKQELLSYLEGQGIETRPIVTGNIARHPVASLFPEFQDQKFPGADEIHERGFYIGLSPLQTDANMERLIDVFRSFFSLKLPNVLPTVPVISAT